MNLTPTQRKIMCLLREHGTAHFSGMTRVFRNHVGPQGGVYIAAYQSPEWFLASRKIIERTDTNRPGVWYRLTPLGETLAAKTTWPKSSWLT